ncbi:hypothetical protein B0A49_01010 [Cryomyces minteri]|uniref:Uncharacterized protein n=1 Tax=Cryomyces minteri TaxID=331657 RepID=A0A4U0XV25_9PEZI|nr:hypothetical protein B0A49_01010 [Cryomyces minteri]
MSIFSKIKGAKQAADQHKAAPAAADDKPKLAPYKHVPTHAAVDALSGAPSSWKAEDRERIIAQNKRRSAMTRTNSDLSNFSGSRGNMHRLPGPPDEHTSNFFQTATTTTKTIFRAREHFVRKEPSRKSRHVTFKTLENQPSLISSSGQGVEMRSSGTSYPQQDVFKYLHKSSTRKVGEAPTGAHTPSPYPLSPVMEKSPVITAAPEEKKRRFSRFGKRSSVVAAH